MRAGPVPEVRHAYIEPRVVVEPPDFALALNDDPVARAAYDNLAYSRKHEHVRAIESANLRG